jgi:hypothetical protein
LSLLSERSLPPELSLLRLSERLLPQEPLFLSEPGLPG